MEKITSLNFPVFEHSLIIKSNKNERLPNGDLMLEERIFEELEGIAINNTAGDFSDFLTLSSHKIYKKIIRIKNFVGVLQTKKGLTLEILPKIFSQSKTDSSVEENRKILLNMLRTLRKIPFKISNMTKLKTEHIPLIEVFISMFLEELTIITKKGLRAEYIEVEENANFFKGKLSFQNHIKTNIVHKEKFYIKYDEYSFNTASNRVIKKTLIYLEKYTRIFENSHRIKEFINLFSEIPESVNHKIDFSQITYNRNNKELFNIHQWCKVFLDNKSFINLKGDSLVFALLFPMEKLFESYVYHNIKKQLDNQYLITSQDRTYQLIEHPSSFGLIPDVVIKNKSTIWILDSKWKLLNTDKKNLGISQTDLYQVFAYLKKYSSNKVALIYPWNRNLNIENLKNNTLYFDKDKKEQLKILFYNLIEDNLETLLDDFLIDK
ncbi:McrC family protein [Neobacillus sp. 179-C4.2 HS]|uniref:McrC family protein n=1 Tax=Neobacillus driksii TaxID=3035913 RepID=A0ABV4YUF8_9BACI|nr:McrC family protein [Neobacillus sp. 179.-C4.2 HS]MDP5192772.1 McrC family protein [Neobacillus sp. 179.-C4.2 HS]